MQGGMAVVTHQHSLLDHVRTRSKENTNSFGDQSDQKDCTMSTLA